MTDRIALTAEELIYVLDREAWDTHWSTLSEAIGIQHRRKVARVMAATLHAQGMSVFPMSSAPIDVPETVYWSESV